MTCDTLTAVLAAPCTPAFPAGTRTPSGTGDAALDADCGGYIIYTLEEHASGRHYVGLTRRTLAERIASHVAQAKRERRVRDGGLMSAIRLVIALGQRFEHCFSARVITRAGTADEARKLERHWIGLLDCRIPNGFNSMPGGSSVGGTDNASPISVTWHDGVIRPFPSIRAALEAGNADRKARGKQGLQASTVYARIASGWTTEEAVGLKARQDPRAVRPAFTFGNAVYTTLEAASEATGLLPDTLRSRLHRAKQSGTAGLLQIGQDRRTDGPGALPSLDMSWPGTDERLTAQEYAARTGVPKATVMHRWHRVRAAFAVGQKPPSDALHAFLTMPAGGKRAAARALVCLLSQAEPLADARSVEDPCERSRPETH